MPEWFLNVPHAEDAKYDTGQATKNVASAAQRSADVRAKQAISEQVQSFVKSFVKVYLSEVEVGDEAEITALITNSVIVISKTELNGARVDKRANIKDTWYTLMVYPNKKATALIAETVKKEMQKEESIYNRFSAKKSFDEMEKEIEEEYKYHN